MLTPDPTPNPQAARVEDKRTIAMLVTARWARQAILIACPKMPPLRRLLRTEIPWLVNEHARLTAQVADLSDQVRRLEGERERKDTAISILTEQLETFAKPENWGTPPATLPNTFYVAWEGEGMNPPWLARDALRRAHDAQQVFPRCFYCGRADDQVIDEGEGPYHERCADRFADEEQGHASEVLAPAVPLARRAGE